MPILELPVCQSSEHTPMQPKRFIPQWMSIPSTMEPPLEKLPSSAAMVRTYSIPVATEVQHDADTDTRSWGPTAVFQPSYSLKLPGLPSPELPGLPTPNFSGLPNPSWRSASPYEDRPTNESSSLDEPDKFLSLNTTTDPASLVPTQHNGPLSESQLNLGIGFPDTKLLWDEQVMLNDLDDGTSSVQSYEEQDKRTFLSSSQFNGPCSSTSSLRTPTLATPDTLTPTASNYSLIPSPLQINLQLPDMIPIMGKTTTELDQAVERPSFT